MKSFLVSDGHYLENSKLSRHVHNVHSMSVEHDDFQVNVVMTQVECKGHKNYGKSAVKCHLTYAYYLLQITSQVLFPGMSNRQMYNDCYITMLDTCDMDTDDDALCSTKKESQHTQHVDQ